MSQNRDVNSIDAREQISKDRPPKKSIKLTPPPREKHAEQDYQTVDFHLTTYTALKLIQLISSALARLDQQK